jgi:protein gp37
MYGSEIGSEIARKTLAFDLPVKRKRDKSYKIPPGSLVFTCFTSDFLLEDADAWRLDCWAMIRKRRDCRFYFFTKRIHRFLECVPDDWGDGYDNVIVGCTVENQAMADKRLPIFAALPIQYKTIIVAPMIERIDLSKHLIPSIQEVSCGGESGRDARPLNFDWVLSLREQCIQSGIPFRFHQTGAKLIKDGKLYYIRRCYQHEQAKKAGVDWDISEKIL